MRYRVEATGKVLEMATDEYGHAVALARSHNWRTRERTRVVDENDRVRWRSWREGVPHRPHRRP